MVAGLLLWTFAALAQTSASAESTRLDARVVWFSGGRALIAGDDSLALEPGDAVEFEQRGRVLAKGEVAKVVDRGVALATISSGSLRGVRRLDRLRVRVVRSVPRLATLRIGYPSRARMSPFRSDDTLGVRPPDDAGYHAEVAGGRGMRWIREPIVATAWPDTLVLRRFDDAADQEIALARGEIDVAVFWPGELSRSLRDDDLRWGVTRVRRARGAIVAAGAARDSRLVRAALDELNRAMLGDDLEPLAHPAGGAALAHAVQGSQPVGDVRFQVEPDWPRRAVFETFLNRSIRAMPAASSVVRLSYTDRPADWVTASDAALVFALRCPVVYRPDLRRVLDAMGLERMLGDPSRSETGP